MSAGPHIFWITSRAAGIAALVLSSCAVGAGLLIRRRSDERKGLGTDARVLHEALSIATLCAIAVHGITLLGDSYLHPSVFDISIPFTGGYRPFWTGLGIIGGWGLAALGLSYYFRSSIGQARWRTLHRFTALFWALGIAHSFGAGTDAEQPWLLIAVAVPTIPALILLIGRLSRSALGETARPAVARRPPAGTRRSDLILSGRES
jgi:sulfoxide reductase heme-binding subunit YedZ